ncbi:hypothetical protein [Streptomyces halobius]|uniref:Uncharacterized protein n=1 Tax=Streptomyces halobius TaxID=2879846 RepID=A0ABY4MKI2_9ACTN|nr:hypothetical protein [Streptomyces halobius]UQA98187.1 hypothetical protein K9S39_11305 [Streptomyces halobius]
MLDDLARQAEDASDDVVANCSHRPERRHPVNPMPPHRWKGPGVLGATGPGEHGPFGPWPGPADPEEDNTPTRAQRPERSLE